MENNSSIPGKEDYRMSRSMGVWILLASLLVNCFLLGILIAQPFHHDGPPPFMGPHGGMVDHLTRGLSPADATIIRDAFQQEKPAFDASHTDMDKAMNAVIQILQQPNPASTDLEHALNNISASHAKFDEAMNHFITQAALHLSPEGRRQFATNNLPPPGMPMPPPHHEHGHDDANDMPHFNMPPPPE